MSPESKYWLIFSIRSSTGFPAGTIKIILRGSCNEETKSLIFSYPSKLGMFSLIIFLVFSGLRLYPATL